LLAGLLCSAGSASVALAAPQAAGEEPQSLFRWAVTQADLGTVRLPATSTGAWASGPNGLLYRSVPSFSGDPTFEILVRAPHSGSALYPERLLVQIPAGFTQKPFHERAVVVGFHKYSVSEKDIFLNTNLPHEAAQRGWMLIAPYGLTDTNFGNPQSQASFAAIAHVLFSIVPFNYRRVYAVGFSMGGLNALSFAMRHLDRQQLQFAGVVLHTPTLDMLQTYAGSAPLGQWLLSNAQHFGGTPSMAAFEYERVSPVRFFQNGLVDADQAPVVNFAHRPIYLHANLADPNKKLVADLISLRNFLQQRGATVAEDLVYEPTLGHHWATLKLGPALDFVSAFELEVAPVPTVEIFADDPGRWLHAEVESISPQARGRFRLELAPLATGMLNSFALDDTRDLDEIRLVLKQLGLDGAQPLRLLHSSADGTADLLRLQGFASAPSSISVNGAAPAWSSYQSASGELWLRPTDDGHPVQIDVLP
jgi:pimeloyl-ACP methyl ester carboxylesterase